MSIQRINGLSFDFDLGGKGIHSEKMSLDITDNSAVVKRNGRPDGYVNGAVEASGEIEVDATGLKSITDAAQSAGSFQSLEPFDIVTYAKVGSDEVKVEAFGCKLKVSKLLDIDKSSSDPSKFTIPFDVTSPDFVKINGVPYIKPLENK